ncbi:MAG: DUF5686 and carboxypeptidase regulatory-like domain-containing protein [Bacteroidota bacterium]|nr:DUF5686 and carboxypeptidase regulatory-like domain-containing protein [Bacteroidota bacterium]
MKIIFSVIVLLIPLLGFSQGIKGTIFDNNSKPLPYASIYIAELSDGASSNLQGQYEINLKPGKYTLLVQFIGYEKQQFIIEIKEDWLQKDIVLQEQVLMLKEIEVKGKREDPALTIMRKAIAKRKYHLLQYDSYQVKVYIKGTGQITNVPFFLKKEIEKEGVKLNEAYTSESVSEIRFEQPDKVEEKVISIRTSGDNSGSISPSEFINQSFYNDKIADAVSPLSGAAFIYYKFTFEGSFKEGDFEINKIKVTPKSRGEQVFEGYIYIVEDLWSIHSLDLRTSILGFKVHAIQNYTEVAPKVWMPVTHQYTFGGKILGFAGEYKYLASCSDYKVVLNEDLMGKPTIIDEKVEEVLNNVVAIKPVKKDEIVEVFENEEKMTRKQFRKMMNIYEKESLKEQKEPEIFSERSYSIDSLAMKRDSAYWAEIRPVPLSEKELKGYKRDDSLAVAHKVNDQIVKSDSSKSYKRHKFKPQDILLGGFKSISGKLSIDFDPLITQVYYNTVEGFNINASGTINYSYKKDKNIAIKPVVRYGFSGETFYYKTRLVKEFEKSGKRSVVFIEGGKFVEQFNDEEPIHPHINTFSSLIFRRNFMKIYEKLYGNINYQFDPSLKFNFKGNLEWSRRNELFENSDFSFFYREPRNFYLNQPENLELENTGFPVHEALVLKTVFTFRPGIVYKIDNGRKIPVYTNAPIISLKYNKGIPNLLGSDINYDQVEIGIAHGYKFSVSGKLEFEIAAGSFLNNRKMYFMDFNHFDGNRTILSNLKPASAYRLLDYYIYSTKGTYFTGHAHYQFRKFLITQLPEIRFTGLRENIFINYLKTSYSPNYYELGYSMDNILKILRIEVAASFVDTHFKEVGLRIGIATLINFID